MSVHLRAVCTCCVLKLPPHRTFGDYYSTYTGLFLTLLGTLLTALKAVFINVLQSLAPSSSSSSSSAPVGAEHHHWVSSTAAAPPKPNRVRLQLHPLDLLTCMSPPAFVQCVLVALVSGELERMRQSSAREMDVGKALTNGCLACSQLPCPLIVLQKIFLLSILAVLFRPSGETQVLNRS